MSPLAVILPLAGILTIAALLWRRAGGIRRLYRSEVTRRLPTSVGSKPVAASTRTTPPPAPVLRYLEVSGAADIGATRSLRAVWEGRMRRRPDQPWFPIRAEQYDFFDDFARTFFIRGRILGIPVVGRDLYVEGEGQMLIRALGLVPVVNDTSPEMGRSGLVTLFNDMCVLAPATLIDERIRWEAIDDRTALGTIRDRDLEVSATLHFDAQGYLVNFITHDRYLEMDGRHIAPPWSTPLGQYRDYGGIRLTSWGSASWRLDSADFPYAEFALKEIEYNPAAFRWA